MNAMVLPLRVDLSFIEPRGKRCRLSLLGDDLLDYAPRGGSAPQNAEADGLEVVERVPEQVVSGPSRQQGIDELFCPAHRRDRAAGVVEHEQLPVRPEDP